MSNFEFFAMAWADLTSSYLGSAPAARWRSELHQTHIMVLDEF